jgi:GNAT superfamily N-acetyltransferase
MKRPSLVTSIKNNLPLRMARPNLENIPEFALPAGFALRWYQPGDEAHWLRIHRAAERFIEITPELFREQFGAGAAERGLQPASAVEHRSGINSALLRERQCYLLDPRGELIGTGTAWFDGVAGVLWGRVHWMAILPEFQGRGLGKALLTAICRRLRELGHEQAYLHTSAARLPALKLYLSFGFEPMIRNAAEQAVWKEVLAGSRRVS